MARTPVDPDSIALVRAIPVVPLRYSDAAADSLTTMVGTRGAKTKKPKRMGSGELVKAIAAMKTMLAETEDYVPTTPGAVVMLYAWLHTEIYGAVPAELTGLGYLQACQGVAQLSKSQFEGDLADVFEFVRWTWARESQTEERNRKTGRQGRRVTWQLQFRTGGILTDYRVAMSRARGQQ